MDDYMLAREEDGSVSLTHWGIRGQKWGTRRYQNSDGSLTQAGRERYGVGAGRSKSPEEKRLERLSRADFDGDTVSSEENRRASGLFRRKKKAAKTKTEDKKEEKPKAKKLSEMSDDELRKTLNRINMEKQYNAYLAEQKEASKSKARKLGERVLKSVGDMAMQELTNAARNAVQKMMKPKEQEQKKVDPRDHINEDFSSMDADTLKIVGDYLKTAVLANKNREILNNSNS